MWLLLAQFAKQKQTAAQAATGAIPPHVELARPRIIPHPAGTIEFEHGQIVAKIGKRDPRVTNGSFHPRSAWFTRPETALSGPNPSGPPATLRCWNAQEQPSPNCQCCRFSLRSEIAPRDADW